LHITFIDSGFAEEFLYRVRGVWYQELDAFYFVHWLWQKEEESLIEEILIYLALLKF